MYTKPIYMYGTRKRSMLLLVCCKDSANSSRVTYSVNFSPTPRCRMECAWEFDTPLLLYRGSCGMHVQVYVHTCTCNSCAMDSRVYWICNPREYIQLHEVNKIHTYISMVQVACTMKHLLIRSDCTYCVRVLHLTKPHLQLQTPAY